jgi:hypothetical protein
MEIRATNLPCLAEHWESDSPQAWAALHPWTKTCPTSPRYSVALESLLQGNDLSEIEVRDDYQKHILLVTAVRLMWITMELEFGAGSSDQSF